MVILHLLYIYIYQTWKHVYKNTREEKINKNIHRIFRNLSVEQFYFD